MRKVSTIRLRQLPGKPHRIFSRQVCVALLIFSCAVFFHSGAMLALHYVQAFHEESELEKLAALTADNTALPPSADNGNALMPSAATPIPAQTLKEPVILEQYRELHRQNSDMVGWVKIDGTIIDYPVMFTGDDFYLSHGFDKAKSKSGVPFIDKRCTVEPFGTNTIIYGHHMKNGTMFAGLESYEDEEYYKAHPTVRFDTLYEQREYEIIAVFRSRIFRKSDKVFKHYNFLNAKDSASFDEYITNIKALSLYDTGVTAEYGDELITLSTCAYHTEHGQFLVVAKYSGNSPN